jgi:hypothetical protein
MVPSVFRLVRFYPTNPDKILLTTVLPLLAGIVNTFRRIVWGNILDDTTHPTFRRI